MQHQVKFSIPERELGNAAIEFVVKKNAQKFGTLKISKGKLVWVPKDNTYGFEVDWSRLAAYMENCKPEKKRV
jgi:hypothetical protein